MAKDIERDGKSAQEDSSLWVIVRSNNNLFGFDARLVGTMITVPKITHVPNRVAYMAGTITVRGSIIALIDLRLYTGQPSAHQETEDFCQLMDQRLADHQNWLTELKASIADKREFTLATNPHKCAFGKWYDNYQSEERTIRTVLAKFDAPHKVIHGIAEKVMKLVHENKIDEAHELVENTSKTELSQMVTLFSEIKEAVRELSRRRIAMVIETKQRTIALDIDEVVAVEHLHSIEDAPINEASSVGVSRLGRRTKSDDIVLLMERFSF